MAKILMPARRSGKMYAAQLMALADAPLVRALPKNQDGYKEWFGHEQSHFHRVVQRLLDLRELEHDFTADTAGNVVVTTALGRRRLRLSSATAGVQSSRAVEQPGSSAAS